jgi:hypothetical protein
MEHWGNIAETGNQRSAKSLSEWHFVQQKSHMQPPGVCASLFRQEASDKPSEKQ